MSNGAVRVAKSRVLKQGNSAADDGDRSWANPGLPSITEDLPAPASPGPSALTM